jgi:Family of unknown function (DUF5677)
VQQKQIISAERLPADACSRMACYSTWMAVRSHPLNESLAVLEALAEWMDDLRPLSTRVLDDDKQSPHRVVAAASLTRLGNLCVAVRLLCERDLFDEAATLVRVMAELAIGVAWVATDDERAWALVHDRNDSIDRGNQLRKKHLGLTLDRDGPPGKRLLPLRERAEQAGADCIGLYAGVYDVLSGPTHGAVCILANRDAPAREEYGRLIAALAVQAGTRLAMYATQGAGVKEGPIAVQDAILKWGEPG